MTVRLHLCPQNTVYQGNDIGWSPFYTFLPVNIKSVALW